MQPSSAETTEKMSFSSLIRSLAWGKIFAALTLFTGYFYHRTWLELSGTSTNEFPIQIWEVPMLSVDVFIVFMRQIFSNYEKNAWTLLPWGFVALAFVVILIGLNKVKRPSMEANARVWAAAKWPALLVGTTILPLLLANIAIFLLGAVLMWMLVPSFAARAEMAYQEDSILKEMQAVCGGAKASTNLFFAVTQDDPVAPMDSLHPRIQRQCGATKCLTLVYDKKANTIRAEVIPAKTVIRTVRGMSL